MARYAALAFLLMIHPALAASSIDSLPATPFPLPDSGTPSTSKYNAWISQNGTDYRATYQQISAPYQGTAAPTAPFQYQLWWNTSTTPNQLEVYDGSQWLIMGYLSASAHTWTGSSGTASFPSITRLGLLGSSSGTAFVKAAANAGGTFTIPNVTGTAVTTGDSGTVTGTMIATGTIAGTNLVAGINIATSGTIATSNTTDASSTTTGALQTAGGLGVGKALWVGTTLNLVGATSGSTVVQATGVASGTLTLPAATDTVVARATTDTLTNKTYDTAGAGNVFKINGTQISAVTGTGSVVLATSPILVTPTLGAATATTVNKVAITAPATGSTLTIADGKTLTASNTLTLAGVDGKTLTTNNSLTLAGTDSTTMTFPTVSSAVLGTALSVGADGLSATPLRILELHNTDGSVAAAAASAGKFGYSISLASSAAIVGEAAQGNTKTDDGLLEYVLPPWYKAGTNITVTVEAKLTGAGTAGTKTAQIKAFKTANDGTQGADIGPGSAVAITAGGADITFAITGATLNPGDRIIFELETVLQETGGASTLTAVVNSVRVS